MSRVCHGYDTRDVSKGVCTRCVHKGCAQGCDTKGVSRGVSQGCDTHLQSQILSLSTSHKHTTYVRTVSYTNIRTHDSMFQLPLAHIRIYTLIHTYIYYSIRTYIIILMYIKYTILSVNVLNACMNFEITIRTYIRIIYMYVRTYMSEVLH